MIAPDLPADLKAALTRLGEGLSRRETAGRAARISEDYRGGGTSRGIADANAALAYAFTRMPATFAAVGACLSALIEAAPEFKPQTLLDVGAGPGTASWCAATAFSSLQNFALLDSNPALHDLAMALAQDAHRFPAFDYRLGNASSLLDDAAPADLVIASYVVNELGEAQRRALVQAMWRKTLGVLLIVEPGTPAGYARILEARDALIDEGAHVAAPCPHEAECPLTAFSSEAGTGSRKENASKQKASPDWCHFAQRLPRLRDHKQIKGVELPFEDEKFSYVALSRTAPSRRTARVLAPPHASKVAIEAKLCMAQGAVAHAVIPRRDKTAYATARRCRWGDAVDVSLFPASK